MDDPAIFQDRANAGARLAADLSHCRGRKPVALARVILAAPVAPDTMLERLRPLVDEIVCLGMPEPFYATGASWADFHEIADAKVGAALEKAAQRPHSVTPG